MPFAAGDHLGPYEILAPLGAGGMGEVYRARDPRIGRDVAIKVLPTAYAGDPDRLRRFEQEVRAAGALNHPNVLTIFDVGSHEQSPYIVSELLEGETLRARMGGEALPLRKAIDYARQTAHGLAAAHAKGIVHRDLKPENLFLTSDGRVKILDFGLAKLIQPEAAGSGTGATLTLDAATEPGAVLGTMGYMSPEQVGARPADHRADIFSLGAILYEMLSGRRAFRGESAVETMHAILKAEPPELAVPPALERIVRRCLEKSPEERFQSASDLGFALEALSTSAPSAVAPPVGQPHARRRWLPVLVGLGLVLSSALVFLVARRIVEAPSAGGPVFRRLTFRRGLMGTARIAPDGQTIVYAAEWEGSPLELYSTRPGSPEFRPLGLPAADIHAISPQGEMAILLHPRTGTAPGTLARVSLAGGSPREVLESVRSADWSPDGSHLAVVHVVGGRDRLEYPIGNILYESPGFLVLVRVSPQGDHLAFQEVQAGRFSIGVIDLKGNKRTLAGDFVEGYGVAWSPNGEEVWFSMATASPALAPPSLHAATLSGKTRLVQRGAGALVLQDISRDGRVLLANVTWKGGILWRPAGAAAERDLSWLDWSILADLSPDGRTILFSETREGGGAPAAVYLRKTDGSPPVRLGEGRAQRISPDGKQVLSLRRSAPTELRLLPTGAGQIRTLPVDGFEYNWASWFPDGERLLVSGRELGRGPRLYAQVLESGKRVPITPEGVAGGAVLSPDARLVALAAGGKTVFYPVEGGDPRPGPELAPGETLVQWSRDGRTLYARNPEIPVKVFALDVASGKRQLWREIVPPDRAGIVAISPILITPDGGAYAYTYQQQLADLYLVEGLR
jgi:Tol biopolymer transport system component